MKSRRRPGRKKIYLAILAFGGAASSIFIGLSGSGAWALSQSQDEDKILDPTLSPLVKLINDGSYSRAKDELEKFKRQKPEDVNIALLAARLYRRIGLWSVSIVEYEKVRSRKPELTEPYIALSEMYLENLSVEMALSMAREAVYRAPDSLRARAVLISSLIANHNMKEARAEIVGLTTANPDNAELLFLSARVNKNLGELDRAEAELTRALSMRPDNAAWLLELAEILEAKGEFRKARDAIEKYLETSPDNLRTLEKLAQLLEFRLQDLDAASRAYDRLLSFEPDNQVAVFGKERIQKKRNDVAFAIKQFVYSVLGFLASTLKPGSQPRP